MKRRCLALILGAFSLALSGSSWADEKPFPNRPLTWIIPMGAGGASDVVTRTIAPFVSKQLGQNIVIDNKPGANGILGEGIVFNAKPDGYTAMVASASVAANPFLGRPNYDTTKFVPVIHLGNVWLIMMVNPAVKASSMQEFLALTRGQAPGTINYGSWGVGGMAHLAGELFNLEAGVKMTHVPYKTSPAAMTGAIGGEIEVAIQTSSLAIPQIKAGKLRALAVAAPTRLPDAPEIPTMAEVGLPGVRIDTWFGIFLPPGTPRPMVDKLQSAVQAALNDPETREKLIARGISPKGGTPEEFSAYFQAEMAKFKRIVSDAKIPRE
jgi:tripartite-type tricarboxylate transporter receptor subunit TctC